MTFHPNVHVTELRKWSLSEIFFDRRASVTGLTWDYFVRKMHDLNHATAIEGLHEYAGIVSSCDPLVVLSLVITLSDHVGR